MQNSLITRFLFVLLTVAFAADAGAQDKRSLEFSMEAYNFGEVREEKGPVSVTFRCVNKAAVAIRIDTVTSSCGCAVVSYTRDSIPPGGGGFVNVVFDPSGRPGAFLKSVTVITTETPKGVEFTIAGNVLPRSRGPADLYPFRLGNLWLKTSHVTFGPVWDDEIQQRTTTIYNAGKRTVDIIPSKTKLPAWIRLAMDKTSLKPGTTAQLTVKYSGALKKEYGPVLDHIILETTDPELAQKRISVSADIREHFPPLTPELKAAKPSVGISTEILDLGAGQTDTVMQGELTLTNSGKGILIIRRVYSPCSCVEAIPAKTSLLPGETTRLRVLFRTIGRSGAQSKDLILITNDPSRPVITLEVKAILPD